MIGYKEWAYRRMDKAIQVVCDGISIRQAVEEQSAISTLGENNLMNTARCKEWWYCKVSELVSYYNCLSINCPCTGTNIVQLPVIR